MFDWYNSCFEFQFQLEKKLADGGRYDADRLIVINGYHSLINHIMINSASKIGFDGDNLHKTTFLKILLGYSDDYSRSVAKNSLWYLDTDYRIANPNQNVGFAAGNTSEDVNAIIPVNRYSFFDGLEDKMLPPIQLQFNIVLQNDNELIYIAATADNGRVVVNRLLLWVTRLTPKDSLFSQFVS